MAIVLPPSCQLLFPHYFSPSMYPLFLKYLPNNALLTTLHQLCALLYQSLMIILYHFHALPSPHTILLFYIWWPLPIPSFCPLNFPFYIPTTLQVSNHKEPPNTFNTTNKHLMVHEKTSKNRKKQGKISFLGLFILSLMFMDSNPYLAQIVVASLLRRPKYQWTLLLE